MGRSKHVFFRKIGTMVTILLNLLIFRLTISGSAAQLSADKERGAFKHPAIFATFNRSFAMNSEIKQTFFGIPSPVERLCRCC